METTATKTLNVVGNETGRAWTGDFTFRGILNRAQRAYADQTRRRLLGPSPEGTQPLPDTNTECFIRGQLSVYIVDAPTWWKESDHGGTVEDYNVILALYDMALAVEEAMKAEIVKNSEEALNKLKTSKKEKALKAPKTEEE